MSLILRDHLPIRRLLFLGLPVIIRLRLTPAFSAGIPAENPRMERLQDIDPLETREWVDSLEAVLEIEGPERAHFILDQLVEKARRSGAYLPYRAQTAYINTIPPHLEERSPGDPGLEARLRSFVRWNA